MCSFMLRSTSKPCSTGRGPGLTSGTQTVNGCHRAYVVRLYPTAEQADRMDAQGHTARALWNLLHEWYTWGGHSRSMAERPSVIEMDRQLRDARTSPLPHWEWLAQLPAQATQQVVKHYVRAWQRYFRGVSGLPRFKKRTTYMSVDVPQASRFHVRRLNRRWGEVNIPYVGRVRFRWTCPLPGVSLDCSGRITGARLTKNSLGWHICFRVEQPAVKFSPITGPPIGVDRGVIHSLALSDGRNLDMPQLLTRGEEHRLRQLERRASRRRMARTAGKPMSGRGRKSYREVASLRARQARRRQDWLHKATAMIGGNHSVVVVEHLRIQSMTRSSRGTIERPGRNVSGKARLNRSILSMGWGKGERMLAYKLQANSGILIRVLAAYSSQTCASCGHVAAESRRSRDRFECVACGHASSADTNAAQVLLARGLAAHSGTAPGHGVAGREAFAVGQAEKRRPASGAIE
jgi:putative transposase